MARDDITLGVGIDDKATKGLKDIAKEADKLDGTKIEVPVEADTDKAEKSIKEIIDDLKKLDGDNYTIALGLKDAQLQGDLSDILADVARADGTSIEIQARFDQANQVQSDIREIEAEIERVNATKISPQVDTSGFHKTRQGLDDVAGSADRAQTGIGTLRGVTDEFGQSATIVGTLGNALVDAGETVQIFGQQMGLSEEKAAKLSGVIGTVGVVATAALAVGVSLAKTAMDAFGASAKHTEEDVKAWAEAMKDGGDGTDKMSANLQNLTHDAKESGGAFKPLLDAFGFLPAAVTRAIGGPEFGILADNIDSIQEALFRAGITSDTFWRLVTDERGTGAHQLRQMMQEMGASVEDQNAVVDAATEKTLAWLKAQDSEQVKQRLLRKTVDDATDSFHDFEDAQTGIEDIPDTWDLIADAIERMRTGLPMTAQQLAAVNDLIAKGVPPDSIWSTGQGVVEQRLANIKEVRDAEKEAAKAQQESISDLIDGMKDYTVAALGAEGALIEMGGAFDTMATKQTGLSAVFDLKNAPLTAAGEVRDISIAISELSDAAEGVDLSKALDPSNVKADKLLDAFDALRPQIQAKVTETFSTDGAPAAQKLADSYIEKIFKEFGGRLSREEIARQTGLDDIQATVRVGIELSNIDLARRQLDILTGLGGETPLTASIKLALDAGTITGEQAQTLIQQQLAGFHVPVPSELAAPETAQAIASANAALAAGAPALLPTATTPPTDASMAATQEYAQVVLDGKTVTLPVISGVPSANDANSTQRYAQVLLNGRIVTLPVAVDGRAVSSGTMNARNDGQRIANANPIIIPVDIGGGKYRLPSGQIIYDAGGTVGPAGGIVAERGPEILNGRYLATRPTVVPPGTRVTSRKRTARIMSHNGTRGLKAYDSGGTVTAGPSTVNVNFNGVGAIGSRFDLMRTVKRANLDRTRLLGTRG